MQLSEGKGYVLNVLHVCNPLRQIRSLPILQEREVQRSQVICLRSQVRFWGDGESNMVSVALQEPSVELCTLLGHYFPKTFCGQSSILGAGDAACECSR